MLVMDEPTNDLDAESLEILEDRLVDYEGTLLVVSHDRAFLNNVVTSMIVFEPCGIREYVGGYDDWKRQTKVERESRNAIKATSKGSNPVAGNSATGPKPVADKSAAVKFSYKEKLELESLPSKIESLEAQQSELHERMSESEYFKRPAAELAADAKRMELFEKQLMEAYARLETLEGRQGV